MTNGFALSRTLDPSDYAELPYALAFVDRVHLAGSRSSERWEYAVALEAITRWCAAHRRERPRAPIYDVGGARSPLADIILQLTGTQVWVIDPEEPHGRRLEDQIGSGTPMGEVVVCVSTLDEVEDLDRFAYLLSCLVAPGGLLVTTMSYMATCGHRGEHTRIFCPKTLAALRQTFRALQLEAFGAVDHRWRGLNGARGPTVVSLVLEKRV